MVRFALLLLAFFTIGANVFAQDSLSDTVVSGTPVLGEPSQESLSAFRKVLLTQADLAVKDKSLTIAERVKARASAMLLRAATMNPAVLSKMHQYAAEQVLADGQAQSFGAIDWSKLAEFIKEMLPIILELIKLFS